MPPQERDLVTLLRMYAGDSRALGEMYDRYATLLHSVAAASLKNAHPDDIAEVVRDTWRQAWTRTTIYDPSFGSVALWLVLLARDRAVERSREMPAQNEAERLVIGTLRRQDRPLAATPEDIVASDRARNVLARLTPLERQAVAAALFEKLSAERIAARLEVLESSARQWVREALSHVSDQIPEEAPV